MNRLGNILLVLGCLIAHSALGQWTEPLLIDSNEDTIEINTGREEWCPFISADGQYLYFAREHINNDLYVCHQTDSGWSDPQKLPFCIERVDERNPTLNTTNDTLYFIQYPWISIGHFGPGRVIPAGNSGTHAGTHQQYRY